ncbi:hypothetical protein nbrc107696_28660 [Gordonia spumicola]|uniref:Uncharacterized protein n=1 Tax=Gordonia spumicola TaxID=589161 RepID=A0A7I9VBL6_9ACTN|nr:helix-turn-helix domain-containing protein [Gordonia spumicola]GEE02420.1 hypothetical protein nbrc107696_28660 [Gordonia spumicola]
MIINPFNLDEGTEAYGYRYYFGVLVAFVALSVAGNVAFFMVEKIPPIVVAAGHGAPPVVFALMVHLGLTLSTSFAGSVRRPGPRAPRERSHVDRASLALVGVLVLSVAVVAGIALVVSFTGLEGLAARMGWGTYAWTLPVLLDVPAGVATIGVLMAMHAIKADALAASTVSADHPADHVDHPTDQTDHPADHPADHGPVVSLTTDQPGPSVSYAQVTPVDHGPSTEDLDEVFEHLVAELDDRPCDSDEGPADQTDHPADHADRSTDQSMDRLAELVREELGTAVDVEQIARALELKAGGASLRAIGAEVGVSHNTVGRWVSCAADLATQ